MGACHQSRRKQKPFKLLSMFKLDAIESELKGFFLRYPLAVLIIYAAVKLIIQPMIESREKDLGSVDKGGSRVSD